ncbi:TniQ family protein [Kitasatospora sp. NPDC094015]|uniref:TniQ family protein n=1 Tax=Kitasatospora sp. NPDC094015 TaxID=3155205 RepID=UPI0033208DA4
MAARAWSQLRRLPAVPVPLEAESLHSWIGALARLHETSVGSVMAALGWPGVPSNPTGALHSAVRGLSRSDRGRIAAATGLSEGRISRMTCASYLSGFRDARPLPPRLPERPSRGTEFHEQIRVKAIRKGHVVSQARFKVCPSCIDEDGGRWPLAWLLPWFVICPRHLRFLLETCECGGPVRSSGGASGRDWMCRQRPMDRPNVTCGRLLRRLPSEEISDVALAEAHTWLLQLLKPAGERGTAEGITPDDLFAVLLLCTERGFLRNVTGLDPSMREAFDAHARAREARMWRGMRGGQRGYSPDVRVMAAGLRMAVPILVADDPLEEARKVLPVDVVSASGVRAISDWLHNDPQWTAMSLVGDRYIPLAAAVLSPDGARVPRTPYMAYRPEGNMSGWSAFTTE